MKVKEMILHLRTFSTQKSGLYLFIFNNNE